MLLSVVRSDRVARARGMALLELALVLAVLLPALAYFVATLEKARSALDSEALVDNAVHSAVIQGSGREDSDNSVLNEVLAKVSSQLKRSLPDSFDVFCGIVGSAGQPIYLACFQADQGCAPAPHRNEVVRAELARAQAAVERRISPRIISSVSGQLAEIKSSQKIIAVVVEIRNSSVIEQWTSSSAPTAIVRVMEIRNT